MSHDLAVVGGGAAGLTAARTARSLGASVVLVQDGRPGGDCTFTGCVPSKTLLAAAAAGETFGLALARVRATVERVAATEDRAALAGEGIDVVDGRAAFRAPGRLVVDGTEVRAERVVLALGSRPARPAVPGLDDVPALTSDDVWGLTAAPGSMVVLGGGSVGVELAQALARLGVAVTLVESEAHLLPTEEPDAGAAVERTLRRDGVDVRAGMAVGSVSGAGGGVRVRLGSGADLSADHLLLATGRRPWAGDAGLDRAGIAVDAEGWIEVDDRMRTSAPGVWAIGDAVGGAQFTHVAARTAWVAVHDALGRRWARVVPYRYDDRVVPRVTYTSPEVARVGLTEAEAARRHRGARVAELPVAEIDRARIEGREEGFIRLVAAPRRPFGRAFGGRLVGATVVAERAGELIAEAALLMQTGAFTGRLAQTVHPYPTWAIGLQMAAAQFLGEEGGRRARPARRAGPT